MKVKFPITIIEPGVYNPFSQSSVDVTKVYTAEVDAADIAGLFPAENEAAAAPAVHMTAAQLRAEYTDAELFAAVEIKTA
jgi:hypothetical protein